MSIQAASHDNGTNPGRSAQYAIGTWKPLLVFILFTLAITAGGYFVFQSYKEGIKSDRQNELGGIAELKTRQITNWMAERRSDAQALKDDPLFASVVGDWLQRGGPTGETRTKLAARLSSMQQAYAAYGYTSISLFDEQAMLRLSSSADEALTPEMEKRLSLESMRTGQITFSDIHLEKHRAGEVIEIDLVTPLLVSKKGRTRTIGAILFRVDPQRFLFPLIKRWPTPSQSAENLLVRRDGDEVVFMNELRHRKNTALAMRLPLSQQELPATMAAMGQEGLVEGVDYRGVPVVGVLSKVPGTSWSMVSKIDRAEIYAPINQLANWMLLLMLALIGAGGGIVVFWRQKGKRQHESELEHQRLAKHLDYLSKHANDIILLHDSTGKIVDFNDRALEAYGYTAEELSGMNLSLLRAIEFSPPFAEKREEVDLAEALIFESTHVRRNSAVFPVESSVRRIDIAGEKYYQAVIRDITERKRTEEELTRQKSFIRQVIDSDPNLIFVKDAEGRFLLANEAMAKSYGQTTEGIVGKNNWELADNWELAGHQEHLAEYDQGHREVIKSRQARVALETGFLADGKSHWFQTIRKPLEQGDGSVSVLTIAMDITELKETEERLQINNRALRLLSACNMALVHIAEEGQLLTEVCKLIVKTGAYRMAWIGFAEHDPEKNVRPVARYGSDEGYLDSANISWADTERGRDPTGSAIRTGVTQVNQSFLSNTLMEPWREAALAHGYQSSIALPLRNGARTFGALTIYSATPDSFNTDEVILLEELADNLAWGITALRMRTEHEQAVEKLRQSEEHFRFLTENATDMIYLTSLSDGRYDYVSPSTKHLTGYTPEEFYDSPKLMQTIIHPGWHAYYEEQWGKLLSGEIPAYFEFQIIHKSGEARWMHQRNAPIWSVEGNGTLIAIQGVVTDITERKQTEEREIRLRHILDSTLDMVFIFRPGSLRFVYINKGAVDSIGYSNEELLLMTPPDIKPLMPEPEFRKFIAPLIAGEKEVLRFETLHRHKNGTDLPVEVQLQLVQEHDGENVFVAIVRDITERRRAEIELKKQKAFIWQVIDTDPNRIFVKDSEGKFLLVNRSAAAAYGLTPNEMIGKNLAEINCTSEEIAGGSETDREVIEEGQEINLVEPYTLPDGERLWFITVKKRLTMPDGSLSVLGIAVDITAQKLSEIKLAESYKKLQQLSLYLENVRADERARIALNLHDEMGATLVAIKMGVAWLASKLPAEVPQLSAEVAHITELVSGGIHTMRRIVTQLRPDLLDDVGLAAAIKDYVKKFRQHTGIECILALPEEEFVLDADQSLTVFRILQESLNNVVKHAQASRVNILFTEQGESLLMVIKDNGIGFDTAMHKEQSFGLLGIRERALMVGGKARISSTPGKGTRVSVSIPHSALHPRPDYLDLHDA